ncbi:hypothetical protein CHC162_08520 [Helicobacter pylori]
MQMLFVEYKCHFIGFVKILHGKTIESFDNPIGKKIISDALLGVVSCCLTSASRIRKY